MTATGTVTVPYPASGILVEAEAFTHYGGWVLDSQYELEMGSPYLLAHGNGKPVADAKTAMTVPKGEEGEYNVWVRAKDWVPGHHPGRFNLVINGATLPIEFGANDKDWTWEFGGKVQLRAGKTTLTLHDLTGFCGRCDAIFFTKEDKLPPPNGVDEQARAWRRKLRGLPDQPVDGGTFDVVVVGGGVVGAAAALTAARLGERVALVHNRPFLGGNASVEVGLRPRGVTGPLVDELSARHPNGDIKAKTLLDAEAKATLFMEYTVYNAATTTTTTTTSAPTVTITSIDARHARTGREIRLRAPIFIDCSGRAILGLYAHAETLFGQESRAEYNESLAPPARDTTHHGNTVFFRTRMNSSPAPFPPVPWATAVAKDFSDLRGQLTRPGLENGDGPQVVLPPTTPVSVPRRMKGPLTHFWEYGNYLDPYTSGERIRDHLLRAIYGTFSNVKTLEPDTYANLALEWVAFVPATGEFRRYKGAYVLSEGDIRSHRPFHDGVVFNDGAFCLHYPNANASATPTNNDSGHAHARHHDYDFRLHYWEWDERDRHPYAVPLRCLYSANVANLLMAGKHVSATHIAISNMKFMGNGAQHALATAAAAHLCHKYATTPAGIYEQRGGQWLGELKELCARITGTGTHHAEDSKDRGERVKSRL
ncbi:hypothetical protein PV04_01264 [Phialophora macrospora]|uniref:FAD dependent oxidoreductase domain-containing protein n=1 Tax=Phialophora macrospora TaxID=1851006 RepID=A0A0D2D6E7_9EURO|nr:hypothetical protein PV04_01264 [Phialophora macrospora]